MALDLSDTLGPVGQQIEDELAALAARIDAIQQAPAQPVDLQPILDRISALEAYDASLKLVKVADILDAIKAAVGQAVAIEGS